MKRGAHGGSLQAIPDVGGGVKMNQTQREIALGASIVGCNSRSIERVRKDHVRLA